MELYLHSLTRLHGMILYTCWWLPNSTVLWPRRPQSQLWVYFPSSSSLYGRNCRAFDLGFTFMSVYIYTYQCELVLSAKLQLQCILVNTWSVTLYNVETRFLAYFIKLLDKPSSLRSDLLPTPARKILRHVFFNHGQINPRYGQLSDHRRTGRWRCLFPYCEISPSAVRNTWFHR